MHYDLGCRITPCYRFPIDVLSKGEHYLAIEIINTLVKEIHDIFSFTETQGIDGIIDIVEKKNKGDNDNHLYF